VYHWKKAPPPQEVETRHSRALKKNALISKMVRDAMKEASFSYILNLLDFSSVARIE